MLHTIRKFAQNQDYYSQDQKFYTCDDLDNDKWCETRLKSKVFSLERLQIQFSFPPPQGIVFSVVRGNGLGKVE